MDFFEEKSKEQLERETYEKAYKKQMKITKLILTIIFSFLGVMFITIGIIMLLLPASDPDMEVIGYVFTPIGAMFILAVIFISILLNPNNTNGAYDRYKKRVNRFGYTNIYDLNTKIQILEKRIEDLERMVK